MNCFRRTHLIYPVTFLFMLLVIFLSGCATQSPQVSRLRITNSGSLDIPNFVVRFPEDNIEFGDVPVGVTTEYMDVPNGIFRYAAYNFEIDGVAMTQPVTDWIGEEPMSGVLFTYTINFSPNRINTGNIIKLIDVKNDD